MLTAQAGNRHAQFNLRTTLGGRRSYGGFLKPLAANDQANGQTSQ
jgi:hypothetical protein